MGYDIKTWSNPINLDSNNLNRIEQGIKNSHDTIEIISEEVSNLQTKQLDIIKEIKLLTNNTPDILNTLNKINSLLQNNDISAIFSSADTFLMKTKQALSPKELKQVYKNLNLDSFIKLSSIKIDGTELENGSNLDIVLPKVDNFLNISSTNAISNMAVTKALQNVQLNVDIPEKLSDLEQDKEHQTVSIQEKIKWDSYEDIINNIKESDPTVPDWAKASRKPYYEYSEILNTPKNLTSFNNDANFIAKDALDTAVNTLNSLIENKSDKSHTHTKSEVTDFAHTHTKTDITDFNHTHNYLPLTGGTLTGNLTISHGSTPYLIINDTTASSNAGVLVQDNGTVRGRLRNAHDGNWVYECARHYFGTLSSQNRMIIDPTNKAFYPENTGNSSIGTDDKRWNLGYFSGALITSGAHIDMQDTGTAYTEDITTEGAANVRKSLYFTDKSHVAWGTLEAYKYAGENALRRIQLNLRNKSGTWSTAKEGVLAMTIDSTGSTKTYAAAPAVLANDTRIATTAWAVENITGTNTTAATMEDRNNKTLIANVQNTSMITATNSTIAADQGGYTHLINLGGSTVTNYASQIAMPYVSTIKYNKMFIRTANGSSGWRKWSEVITDDPAQLLQQKYIKTLKISINDNTVDTTSGDYRWPLTSPVTYTAEKRYLVGVPPGLNSRYSNATQNVYAQNNNIYANVVHAVPGTWFCTNDTNAANAGYYKFLTVTRKANHTDLSMGLKIRNCYAGNASPLNAFGDLNIHVRYGTATSPSYVSILWGDLYNLDEDCIKAVVDSTTGNIDFYIYISGAWQTRSFTISSGSNRTTQDFTQVAYTKVTSTSPVTSITANYTSSLAKNLGLPLGTIIPSTVPITDSCFHLLDGSTIAQTGMYAAFATYLKSLQTTYPNLFTTETNWQTIVETNGECGKFVIDDTAGTIRLPKIVNFIQGTISLSTIGDAVAPGIPNIYGKATFYKLDNNTSSISSSGALSVSNSNTSSHAGAGSSQTERRVNLTLDASKYNSLYGASTTVQPRSILYPYYIVLATAVKTQTVVDIDTIATDVNNKLNKNDIVRYPIIHKRSASTEEKNAWWYTIYNDGWKECGGHITGSGTSQTINLPLPDNGFSDTTWTLATAEWASGSSITITDDDTGGVDFGIMFSNKTNSSIRVTKADSRCISYIACGR